MNEVTKAYIAGIFDGEGSVSFVWRKASKNGKRYGKLLVRVSQNDRSLLDWIKKEMHLGSVHPRNRHHPKWNITHDFVAAYEMARIFLKIVYPYLRVKKNSVREKLRLDRKYCKRRA